MVRLAPGLVLALRLVLTSATLTAFPEKVA
jgi:hypothetical protein